MNEKVIDAQVPRQITGCVRVLKNQTRRSGFVRCLSYDQPTIASTSLMLRIRYSSLSILT